MMNFGIDQQKLEIRICRHYFGKVLTSTTNQILSAELVHLFIMIGIL